MTLVPSLSRYIINVRKGQKNEEEDEIQLMKDLVTKYTSFEMNSAEDDYEDDRRIRDESVFSNERTIVRIYSHLICHT